MSYAVDIDSVQTDPIENKPLLDTPLSKLFRRLLVSIEKDLAYSNPIKAYLFVIKHNNILSLYDTYNIDPNRSKDCPMISGRSCYCGSAWSSTEPVVIDYDDTNNEIQCNGIFPDSHIVIPIVHDNVQVALVNVSLPVTQNKSQYTNDRYPAVFDLVSGYLGAEISYEQGVNKIDRTGILLNSIDGMVLELDKGGSVINIESENNIMNINIGLFLGHPLTNHFTVQDSQTINDDLERLSSGLSNRVKGEYEYKDRNGNLHSIELTIYPSVDDNRSVGFTVVCRNIDRRKNTESRFNNLLESAPDAIVIADKDGRMVTVNERCATLFGYGKDELIGQYVEILLPDQLHDVHRDMRETYTENPHGRLMSDNPNLLARHKSGFLKSVEISLSPFKQGNDTLTIAIVRDISYRKSREKELGRLAFVTEHSPDPIIEIDESGRILYANKIATVLSFDDTEGDAYKHVIDQYKNTNANKESQDILPRNLELGGRIYRQKVRHVQGSDSYFVYFRDITDGQEISNKLGVKEKTDSLTGLSNRIAFIASLKDAINRSNIQNVSHTILYIDLDDFMALNDAVLSDINNREAFLRMVARLLKDNIRQADTLARLQDGIFSVLLEYCPVSKGFQVAEKIKATLNGTSLDWQDEKDAMVANIGVVEVARSFDSYHEILGSAEAACLSAKENGNNSIFLYNKKAQMLRIRDKVAS